MWTYRQNSVLTGDSRVILVSLSAIAHCTFRLARSHEFRRHKFKRLRSGKLSMGPLWVWAFIFDLEFCPRLSPSAATHARTAHASLTARGIEIIGTLRAFRTHLLLSLQIGIGLGRGLPAAAGVRGPITALAVVTVDVAVFPRIDVVVPASDSAAGVRDVVRS